MTTATSLQRLGALQTLVRALVEGVDDATCRRQFHPSLSPFGWHLGHCVYTECYWLYEVVRSDRELTAALEQLYMPANKPKPQRGAALAERQQLLHWAQRIQQDNLRHLAQLPAGDATHPLFVDGFLQHFLIQHYCQHYETMIMALQQSALQSADSGFTVRTPLQSRQPLAAPRRVTGGHYRIGGKRPLVYDNELPVQRAELGSFDIDRRPVSNAEYLSFMRSEGYEKESLWSNDGWRWRRTSRTEHPDHWRRDRNNNWYGVGLRGSYELLPDEPVSGVNFFEAEAYARWAGGRLPHEYQWETACRLNLLQDTGRVWEWCGNPFHPYDGFTPFPYAGYSVPWFDGEHQTLRGGSLYTQPEIRRASFRNFYSRVKRHIFAGIRLAY